MSKNHTSVYFSDALRAQLELEERAGGFSPGIACRNAALAELVDGAPEGSAAGRLAKKLRLVTVADRVLGALAGAKSANVDAVAAVTGLKADIVSTTLQNLSRLKDEDGKALVTCVKEGKAILWSLTA